MSAKFSWPQDIINFVGAIVGIVLTAIGSVMFLNTILKVYVFGFQTESYFSAEQMCGFRDAPKIMLPVRADPVLPANLSEAEMTACIEEKTTQATAQYLRRKKESLIDGFAMLLVGIPFWILFERRRKKRS